MTRRANIEIIHLPMPQFNETVGNYMSHEKSNSPLVFAMTAREGRPCGTITTTGMWSLPVLSGKVLCCKMFEFDFYYSSDENILVAIRDALSIGDA